MVSLLRLAIVGGAVAVVDAKWLAGGDSTHSTWAPPKETFGATKVDPMGWTPKPTVAVAENIFQKELRKRAVTSTCGYFAGTTGSAAIRCINSASCVVNAGMSAIGCCNAVDVASCKIPTVCLDRTKSASWVSGQTYTTYCSSSEFPYCVTYAFAASVSPYAGYKALGCGVSARSYTVEYYDPGDATSAGSSIVSSSARSSSSPITTSSSGGSTSASSTTTSAQTSAATSSSPVPEASQGTPVGPIVGGVVGGVAGLALIGFGVFFLMRYSKKNKDQGQAPPPALQPQPTGATGPYPPSGGGSMHYGQTPPPMSQTPQQYGAYPPAAYAGDNRHSIAPSSFSGYPAGSVSDPMSPKTGATPTYVESHYTGQSGYTPPPPGAPGAQQAYAAYNGSPQSQQPYPPQGQPQQYQAYNPTGAPVQPPPAQYPQHQQGPPAMELPTSRPERELRELA